MSSMDNVYLNHEQTAKAFKLSKHALLTLVRMGKVRFEGGADRRFRRYLYRHVKADLAKVVREQTAFVTGLGTFKVNPRGDLESAPEGNRPAHATSAEPPPNRPTHGEPRKPAAPINARKDSSADLKPVAMTIDRTIGTAPPVWVTRRERESIEAAFELLAESLPGWNVEMAHDSEGVVILMVPAVPAGSRL